MDNNIATKADIQELGRAMDGKIRALDGKVETMGGTIKRMAIEIVQNKADVDQKFERLSTQIDQGNSRIIHYLQSFAGKLDDLNGNKIIVDDAVQVQRFRIDDHERRLIVLESNPSSKSSPKV